jgi:Niemann-Pick C1 protein
MFSWDFYANTADELTTTTILGVLTVCAIGFIFIPHWSAVLFLAPLIGVLYIDLMGFLQFTGNHLNVVSYFSLILSIGLLVDFLMHMMLRYYESPGDTRESKVKAALNSMGASVLVGGVSTMLGVLPLAFSTSELMRTVFVAFIGMVGVGITHGLVVLPVILSLFGPTAPIREYKPKPAS